MIHHLPAEPAYLRVKVRRRLERIGAVPVKSSVYALPRSEETLEDLHWLLGEITREGGEAALAAAAFLDPATELRLVERSRDARDSEYRELMLSAAELAEAAEGDEGAARSHREAARRLEARLEQVKQIDFFGADTRAPAERAIAHATRVASGVDLSRLGGGSPQRTVGVGRTWVTRAGVKIDRVASAWLIRRFIDPEARFAFEPGTAQTPGTIRFDTYEGEFTHEGDRCTFETLLAAFELDDPALHAIGEVVHDLDNKDDKFGRPEAPGVASLVDGVIRAEPDDAARLEKGAALFDALLQHFRARRP